VSGALLLAAALTAQASNCTFHEERGTVVHSTQPAPRYEAGANPAFASGRFSYAGSAYASFGAPQQMAPMEIEAFGELGGVPLFVAAGTGDDSVVFVMVKSAGCVFQRYAKG
jgi:hypothetical protein